MVTTSKTELFNMPVTELSSLIKSKELSPVELTKAYLDRIEAVNDKVGAFINLMSLSAMAQAKKAEAEIAAGDYKGPLHGITFAVKDQMDSENSPSFMRGSTGSLHLEDATAITKLKAAGAIYMGKLVMSGQPDVPQPKNPWDLERVTGGSSSGSGAALAAGLCSITLGEDSAGSIRNPASLNSLVGVIGTYGRVSRFGLASMGWTIDHCGPLAWTVKDAVAVFETIAGYDPKDQTTSDAPVPSFSSQLEGGIEGKIIGVPMSYIESEAMAVQPDVLAAFKKSLETLESLGAKIVDVELPLYEQSTLISFVLYTGEYFAEYMSQMEWFSDNAREARLGRMGLGALTTAGDYLHAQKLRAYMRNEYKSLFEKVDLISTPSMAATAPTAAAAAGENSGWWKKPTFAAAFNVTGMPAMTVPGGFDSEGLPIGLQLAAAPFDETTMFKAAYAYEQATPWHELRPALS